MQAIETRYQGCRFRSRLEARWAVFFTAVGIAWVYEAEGFDLKGFRYLPDFWLPDHEVFVEIKPRTPVDSWDAAGKFLKEHRACKLLSEFSGRDVIMLRGDCWPLEYEMFGPDWMNEDGSEGAEDLKQLMKCRRCNGLCWAIREWGYGEIGKHTCGDHERWPVAFTAEAYAAARSARFEFGETPG